MIEETEKTEPMVFVSAECANSPDPSNLLDTRGGGCYNDLANDEITVMNRSLLEPHARGGFFVCLKIENLIPKGGTK